MGADTKKIQPKPDPPISYNPKTDCVRCGEKPEKINFFSQGEYPVCDPCHMPSADVPAAERIICDPIVVIQYPERPKKDIDKFWEKE